MSPRGHKRTRRSAPRAPRSPSSQITIVSDASVTDGGSQTIAFTIPGPLTEFRITSLMLDYTSAIPVTVQLTLRGTEATSNAVTAVSPPASTGFSHRTIKLRQPRKTDWTADTASQVPVGWLYLRTPGTFSTSQPFVYGIILRYSKLSPVLAPDAFSQVSLVTHASPPAERIPRLIAPPMENPEEFLEIPG